MMITMVMIRMMNDDEIVIIGGLKLMILFQFQVPTVATPTKSPAQRQQISKLPSDKRLLAKVIKASGLKQGNSGEALRINIYYAFR